VDPISSALIEKALDGLSQRYTFTAQNIANANTPNYRPVRVSFEEGLRQAAAGGERAIDAVRPQTFVDPRPAGDGVRLDLELATASQTAMRYRALLDLLGQQLRLERTILTGGR
jgi:flagellar basal-body rod protein FlgB